MKLCIGRLIPIGGILAGMMLGLVAGTAPEALAQDAIFWGGEWKSSGNVSFHDATTDVRASTSLRLQAQTDTYSWRAFFDGRIGIDGPVTGEGDWESSRELNRLYLRLYLPSVDLSLGKQAINWGVGYAFDPTDVFNPPDPTNPEGIRPGITSAVARIPVGILSYWSLVATEEKYGIRRRGNVDGTDWSVLAVADRDDTLIGADAKGDLGVGWHAAAAYRIPVDGSDPSLQGLIGADYSWLLGDLVWRGEYLTGDRDAPKRNRTFQRLTYKVDDFTSLYGSVLADLSTGSHRWNVGVTTLLGGQSQLSVVATALPDKVPSGPGRPPSASLKVEFTRAF